MPRLAEATRAARRSQIIAAAAGCFARAGYHAATMADVATAAGVSKGTPYLYFASKEALFIALHDEWDCGLADRVDATIQDLPKRERESPRRVLRTVALAVGAHVAEQVETCRVLMEAHTLAAYYPPIAAVVQESDSRTHRQLQDIFQAGIAVGEWAPDTDPQVQARVFAAGLHGLMAQWHLAPGSFSWDAAASALIGDPAQPGGRRE